MAVPRGRLTYNSVFLIVIVIDLAIVLFLGTWVLVPGCWFVSAVLQDQLTRESLRQSLRQRFFEPDSDPDTDFPSPPQFQDFSCLSWLKPTTIAPKSIDLVDIGIWHTEL